jgi:hypothetical protein
MRKVDRPGRRVQQVCTGTLVHYEQTNSEEQVARPGRRTRQVCVYVCGYGPCRQCDTHPNQCAATRRHGARM